MDLKGKINATITDVKTAVNNGVDNFQLDGKIAEQNYKIKELTKEIGELAVLRLDAGNEMAPEIMERYAAIKSAKEMIEELENERKVMRIACPECGAKTSSDMNYCCKCGTKLKKRGESKNNRSER